MQGLLILMITETGHNLNRHGKMFVMMCILFISNVWKSCPEELRSIMPSGVCPSSTAAFSISYWGECSIPILPKCTLDYIWSYLARKLYGVPMKWAGLLVCSGECRQTWQRGQRWRSTHPDCAPAVTSDSGESPETWIDFFERDRTKFQISVDLPWWKASKAIQRRSKRRV